MIAPWSSVSHSACTHPVRGATTERCGHDARSTSATRDIGTTRCAQTCALTTLANPVGRSTRSTAVNLLLVKFVF